MTHAHNKKGFTLIELLIVIGILAVLSTITVLVLNPAELFRQARDSQRLADLDTVRDALIFAGSTANPTPAMTGGPNSTTAHLTCNGGIWNIYTANCVTVAATNVTGTGWVPVDLVTGAAAGAPLARLPVDPTNDTNYFYTFKGTAAGFRLGAVMESVKYGTTTNMAANDGGSSTAMYEIGTAVTTSPL